MHGFKGERVLMRIHVEEQDEYKGRALYEAIVLLLRKRHFAGATVFQGTLGFGASSHVHTEHMFQLKQDLPIIIECVDTEEKIVSVLRDLDAMIGGGLITLERVRVIMYRDDIPPDQRDADTSIDITGRWRAITDDDAGAAPNPSA